MKVTVSAFLKLTVIIASLVGIVLCATDKSVFMGGETVFLYFTIQSNMWICAMSAAALYLMLSGARIKRWMSIVKLVLTVSITLTGMVFCFMLAPVLGAGAFNLPNILTHVVVPVAAVADFFVCRESYDLRMGDALWVIVPPLYYLGFASLGYVLGWQFSEGICYPYFFLNWGSPLGAFGFSGSFPYMGVMWYVLFLLVMLLLCGRLYIRLAMRGRDMHIALNNN